MEGRMISASERQSRLNPIRLLHLERNADQSSLVKLKLKAEAVPCVLRGMEKRADFIAALKRMIST